MLTGSRVLYLRKNVTLADMKRLHASREQNATDFPFLVKFIYEYIPYNNTANPKAITAEPYKARCERRRRRAMTAAQTLERL